MHPTFQQLCIVSVLSLAAVTANGATDRTYNLRGISIDYSHGMHPVTPAVQTHNQQWQGRVVEQAVSLAGTQYHFGGNTPETGFDCSGFVQYVFKQATNIKLPRTAAAMRQVGTTINKNALQDGDLVFFNTTNTPNSHVGIYIGHHQIIHAPSSGRSVSIENMDKTYWSERYNGAMRITATQ